MEGLKGILTKSLLAFVLISVGYVLGKHSVSSNEQAGHLQKESGRQVVVYYFHATSRCFTCNAIQQMTRELLENSYGKELTDEKLLWIPEDFQKNEVLARLFDVAGGCVVVAEMRDGVMLEYKRLDDIWTVKNNPQDFNRYIGEVIDAFLGRKTEK